MGGWDKRMALRVRYILPNCEDVVSVRDNPYITVVYLVKTHPQFGPSLEYGEYKNQYLSQDWAISHN
jgi:hypothetical protein